MKNCELCDSAAKLYCESDQANLCWECDRKVHSANFLVAKHNRTLLCHVCQSPTSFNLSGSKSRPGKSICHVCARRCRLRSNKETHIGDHHIIAYDGEDEDEKVQVLTRVLITGEEECSSNFCSINGGNLKDGMYRPEFYQKGKRKVAKSCSKVCMFCPNFFSKLLIIYLLILP